eukprot:7034478-Pyramimonas_sp.AAC.1
MYVLLQCIVVRGVLRAPSPAVASCRRYSEGARDIVTKSDVVGQNVGATLSRRGGAVRGSSVAAHFWKK